MQPQQLQLRDIHLPDAVGWWPPAIGWWILAIVMPLLCWLIIWVYKWITRRTATKTAKKLLVKIKSDSDLTDEQKLIALSTLIRRVAISISPRKEVASLTGQAWLTYLDRSVKESAFSQGIGQCFADRHYQKNTATHLNMPELIKLCEDWLSAQKNNTP
ncbi:MAG: DUF4381 domain-containing protein [Methylococcales bacterium]|nr:DUF4381 domain-containing protein [Methylococcales bacterium]